MKTKTQSSRKRSSKVAVKKVVAAIRPAARGKGSNNLSMREIDREIRAYRAERSQKVSTLHS